MTQYKALASRLSCCVAQKIMPNHKCKSMIQFAERLGIKVDYEAEKEFPFTDKIIMSHYKPHPPTIIIFGDQIWRYCQYLQERGMNVGFEILIYHAVAQKIGHHLWRNFSKKELPKQKIQPPSTIWNHFEKWAVDNFIQNSNIQRLRKIPSF